MAPAGRHLTESEWLAARDPRVLFRQVQHTAGDRKVRLFACACCRLVWPRLAAASRTAVETAERFADGETTRSALTRKQNEAWELVNRQEEKSADEFAATIAWQAAFRITEADPDTFLRRASRAMGRRNARATLLALLRDVFGNPFRPPAVDPAWLSWQDGTVTNLARSIYDGRAFERLPILGDALEEAGCADAGLLEHCRGPGAHARGCFVLDGILGRE
jgi:hypothetical protein